MPNPLGLASLMPPPEKTPDPKSKVCTVAGCEKDIHGHGMCHSHYQKEYRKRGKNQH